MRYPFEIIILLIQTHYLPLLVTRKYSCPLCKNVSKIQSVVKKTLDLYQGVTKILSITKALNKLIIY